MSEMHCLLQNTDPNLQPWGVELQQNAFSWGRSTRATKGLSHSQAMLCFTAVQQIRRAACCPAAGLNSSMSCTQCFSLARTPRHGSAGCRCRTPSRFCFWKQVAEQGTVQAVCGEVGMSFGVPVWFWWLLEPPCLHGARNLLPPMT